MTRKRARGTGRGEVEGLEIEKKDQSCLRWSMEEAANFCNEMDLVQLVVVVRWFLSRIEV